MKAKNAGASSALLDEMSYDAPAPSADKLDQIRGLARELRDGELLAADLEARISRIRERRKQIIEKELVDVMDAAGMRDFTLEGEGNLPPFAFEVGAYYHANIQADWPEEQRKKAFSWIGRYHPGMLRNTIVVTCGKNTAAAQKKVAALCQKLKIPFKNEYGVPWNTLTAFVREQIEEEGRTPPLDLLGATVGRVVKIKKAKEK